jgi:hypothetical protein
MHLHGRQPRLHPSHVGQPAQTRIRLIPQRIRLIGQLTRARTSRSTELSSQRKSGGTEGLQRLHNSRAIHTHSMTGGTDKKAVTKQRGIEPSRSH